MGVEVAVGGAAPVSGLSAISVVEGPVLNFGQTLSGLGPILEKPLLSINEGPISASIFNDMTNIRIDNLNLRGSERFAVPDVFQSAFVDISLDPTQEPMSPLQVPGIFQSALTDVSLDSTIMLKEFQAEELYSDPIAQIVAIYGQPEVIDVLPEYAPVFAPEPALEIGESLVTQVATQPKIEPQVAVQLITQSVEPAGLENEGEEPNQEEGEVVRVKVLHIIDAKGVIRRIAHIVRILRGIFRVKNNSLEKKQTVKGSEASSYLLPSNKQEIRGGEINNRDPQEQLSDETWEATKESLKNIELGSEEQIQGQVEKIVLNNHPVGLAAEGELASQGNIDLSHRYINGLTNPYLLFEKRRSIKRQRVEVIENRNEGTIDRHFELAQALQAA